MMTTERPVPRAWEEVECSDCHKRNFDLDRERGLIRYKCNARDCKVVHVEYIGPVPTRCDG